MTSTFTTPFARALIVLALCAATGCRGDSAPKVALAHTSSLDTTRAMQGAHALLGPAAKAQLDTGNTLYRRKEYPEALAHYKSAGELAPQHAAPLFGVYMVARATHDSVMAEGALAGIRKRNGPLPTPAHSLRDSALDQMHANLRKGRE
ncbi:MAG: hypothetical protein ABJE47_20335 [bacterium]